MGKKGKNFKKDIKGKKEHYYKKNPIFRVPRTFGQKAADWIATWAGSWTFIIIFFAFLGVWMFTNGYFVLRYLKGNFTDPYPFILLNLALSCLAAIQAPIILMSQNRQIQRDRTKAEFDYRINKKAEKEIQEIKKLLIKYHTKEKK